jgi:DNA mismatch repair protein MutS2
VLDDIQEQVEILEEKIQKPVKQRVKRKPVPKGELRIGEKIILTSLKKEGIITSISAEDVEVQIGSLRMRARLNEIQRKGQDDPVTDEPVAPLTPERGPSRSVSLAASPGIELDLRGQRSEEALALLEDYLDRAFMAGMPFVRIIHGKGTGKLRSEVRRTLQGHPQIASFDEGEQKEGGAGVTVVKMLE